MYSILYARTTLKYGLKIKLTLREKKEIIWGEVILAYRISDSEFSEVPLDFFLAKNFVKTLH